MAKKKAQRHGKFSRARREEKYRGEDRETVAQFLKRGGKVTVVEHMPASAIPASQRYIKRKKSQASGTW